MFASVRNLAAAKRCNALLETALIAFFLGCCAMGGVTLMLHAWWYTNSAAEFAFGMSLLVVHVMFHFCEFIVAAAQRPRETHPEAFMIFHSPAYLAANAISLLEFFVEVYAVPESWKAFSPRPSSNGGIGGGTALQRAGFFLFRLNFAATIGFGCLVVVFYTIRTVAMLQCGPNFSLMIETERRPEHKHISTGVYSVLRHPAYFGWFWRVPCTQLMLANPICTVVHTAVTWYFFYGRIPYEENVLEGERFFGEDYRKYKARTIVGIPFIRA